jgi:hypothetical protein
MLLSLDRTKEVHLSSIIWRLFPALILLPASLAAQTTLDSVARRLKPGQTVRLHLQTGQRAEGRFAVYQPDQSVVQLAMRDTTIQFAMIDSIWVRKTGAGTGAIIGAVLVGVPSALLWGSLCSGLSDSGGGCDQWGTVIGLSVAGAGAGALLGAAIGSASSHWQLRYAAPRVSFKVNPLPAQRLGVGLSIPLAALIR